ncbi:hypothetical protein [Streptomyces sp. NPDC101132]|uniref:hypothetical protein n=1 Tax=Streptomyces sp. NPDC101132 TaxID=3366110 RepID=UPI0037F80B3C
MGGPTVRWDQRAVALVELRGTLTDRQLFEEAVAARGWPVLERRGREVTAVTEGVAWYVVEVRFPGSEFRSVVGARQRLEVLAEELRLALVVEAVDRVARPSEVRPGWVPAPAGGGTSHRSWTRAVLAWGANVRQLRAGSETAARALAARPLPGAPGTGPGDAVRRLEPGEDDLAGRRAPVYRRQWVPLSLAVIAGVGATEDGRLDPSPVTLASGLVLVGAAVACAALLAVRSRPDWTLGRARAVVTAPLVAAALVAAVLCVSLPDALAPGPVLSFVAPGTGVVVGLWLLTRQASWRVLLPWLVPAALPLVPGLLPGLGVSLPALYLRAFGLDLEDVEVASVQQLQAALKVLVCMGVWLVAPAFLGFLKHLHLMIRGRWGGYAAFAALSAFSLLIGAWTLAFGPALEAGRAAVADAAEGRQVAPYYGVEPEWVCAGTVRPVAQVPVEGGVLDPRRAYLLVGDAGGTAVLWDRQRKAALKVPLAALRLVPAGDPRRTCP